MNLRTHSTSPHGSINRSIIRRRQVLRIKYPYHGFSIQIHVLCRLVESIIHTQTFRAYLQGRRLVPGNKTSQVPAELVNRTEGMSNESKDP